MRRSMSSLVPDQNRRILSDELMSFHWRKIPKGCGIKYPVTAPKWCMPFSNLNYLSSFLNYSCLDFTLLPLQTHLSQELIPWVFGWRSLTSYKLWWCRNLQADWQARISWLLWARRRQWLSPWTQLWELKRKNERYMLSCVLLEPGWGLCSPA